MRRRSLIRFAVSLFLVSLCLSLPLAAEQAPVAVGSSSAASRAEAKLYGRYVDLLASEEMGGRGPGTPGARKARAYLVGRLRAAGLKPGFGGDYCQVFVLTLGKKAQTQQLRAVGADKKALDLQAGRDFNALGFSASRIFSGKAVFVGYAITNKSRKYDNFAGLAKGALKGRVAVALRYEPQDDVGKSLWTTQAGQWSRSASLSAKTALASRYGASALLIVSPPAHAKEPLLTAEATGRGRGGLPILHVSTDAMKRILASAGLDADKEIDRLAALADTGGKILGEIPGLRVSGRVVLKPVRGKTYNVAAALPGRGNLAGEVVIVGAHWDHLGRRGEASGSGGYFPGANDNASGTAGVLMLAKRFAARARTGIKKNLPAHRRKIVFAFFGAEERGLIGSAYMARHFNEMHLKTSQVAAMVNMDMIGRLKDNRLSVWGVDSGEGWAQAVRSAGKDSGLKLAMSGGGLGPSDHASFYRRKIPVVCFSTGMYPDLHRRTDTSDKIDSGGAIRILGVVDRLVRSLAERQERIPYAAPRGGSGRRVMLGVQLDPSRPKGGGVRLAAVMEDAPAGKAGLREGDVVTHWADKAVGGVADLRAALAKAKPGDTVRVTVRRGKETLQATVKFPAR